MASTTTPRRIIYTITDEAPALATCSLLPIVRAFTAGSNIRVETRDISLAGRTLAAFPEYLRADQRVGDDLAELGRLATLPEANIIKLPNISASMPQLKAAIAELQAKGFALPGYPDEAGTEPAREVRARYDRIKGSAVNPVLREGNSDRRAPNAVKQHARKHPHSMGAWSPGSRTEVAHMTHGDFRSNEKSLTLSRAGRIRIELEDMDGNRTALRESVSVLAGEVIDATTMSAAALDAFLEEQIADARSRGLLFSLHLKATMMKVSDPIIFGHAVRVFFENAFAKHRPVLDELGFDPNNGIGDLLARIQELSEKQRAAIEADLQAAYANGPGIAMVNSELGITNLHVPSDVIVDASMPAMIRTSGQMWNKDGEPQDCKAVIPDSSYAGVYQAVIDDCQANGAYDPATMGTVPNVGLMAQKAEEYGSHDKTFEIPVAGTVRVVGRAGDAVMTFEVGAGDVWRMCNVRDLPVQDWVKLAVNRARATGSPTVFWLDDERAHDRQLIEKVERYLGEHDTDGLDIRIMSPVDATKLTVERIRQGQDTISVTGNVLRDYNTDLFPILEVGTSAKMLSIVPLMNGGGLFETGAGGSAPKHVQQFVKENYLRWDSLGEFTGNRQAKVLGETLDIATGRVLEENKSPARRLGQIDNRGSHAWLAVYWSQALAEQTDDPELAERFAPIAAELSEHADTIDDELIAAQGSPVDLGGYYQPDPTKAAAAMRPSKTLNDILDAI
jgi:isocitrate dehydrogenase